MRLFAASSDIRRVPFGGNYCLIAGLSSIDIHPVCSIIPTGIIQGKQPGGIRERETRERERDSVERVKGGKGVDVDVSQG